MTISVLACSERILEQVMGPPQRGLVHSAFTSAANLGFANGFLLSLNASPSLALMPNGLLLEANEGAFPFTALKAGMPVVLGTGWLALEAIACSLDCTCCPRWNPRIEHPESLNMALLRDNACQIALLCQSRRPLPLGELPVYGEGEMLEALAETLCGRGPGLTPSGDDFLAGCMAVGWLLYGPQPAFLASCQCVNEIARRRTHELSQCWLAYAAAGDVASPIGTLLSALTSQDQEGLERATTHVLALGASSGYDLLQGILYGIKHFPMF